MHFRFQRIQEFEITSQWQAVDTERTGNVLRLSGNIRNTALTQFCIQNCN